MAIVFSLVAFPTDTGCFIDMLNTITFISLILVSSINCNSILSRCGAVFELTFGFRPLLLHLCLQLLEQLLKLCRVGHFLELLKLSHVCDLIL